MTLPQVGRPAPDPRGALLAGAVVASGLALIVGLALYGLRATCDGHVFTGIGRGAFLTLLPDLLQRPGLAFGLFAPVWAGLMLALGSAMIGRITALRTALVSFGPVIALTLGIVLLAPRVECARYAPLTSALWIGAGLVALAALSAWAGMRGRSA
ncbi:hypothetical protein [Pseudothioclava nitratireducens]|uniref:hypothetical protein n=1 Tax=Pseudothioclava nitratireducens TaxID=1928646 RepID=UPI0023DC805C|nr:hypothetical protein [Defluviimonas nitratireducens]MDF1620721.1 hypothetical protein [Defluviimonas nitratireducens]